MTLTFPRSLSLAFGVVQALAAAVAVFAVVSMHTSSRTAQQLVEREASELVAVERLRASMQRQVATTRGYLLSGNPELRLEHDAAMRSVVRQFADLRRSATPEGRERLERLGRLAEEHRGIVLGLLQGDGGPELRLRAQQDFERIVLPNYRVVEEALDAYAEHQRASYAAALREATSYSRASHVGIAFVVALGLLLGGGLARSFGKRLAGAYEAEREARRIAQSAVAARQDLLGSVAHDLRNPLSAITLKSHLIARALPPGSRPLEHAQSIQRVAARMQFLIGSLLDGASLEAGGLQLGFDRWSARSLLASTVELFEAQAAERQIALEPLLPDPGLEVWADRERLLQVFSNLVGNALKFTPPGGSIRLSCERAGDRVRLAVADTGSGIPPEDLPRVFDRYWKRDAESSRRGTGLGLYIARGIVERHGGRIWVESEPGAGTTFCFEVPAFRSAPLGSPEFVGA